MKSLIVCTVIILGIANYIMAAPADPTSNTDPALSTAPLPVPEGDLRTDATFGFWGWPFYGWGGYGGGYGGYGGWGGRWGYGGYGGGYGGYGGRYGWY